MRVLITGANKGIGLATARKVLLAQPKSHVLLGSRDLNRGLLAKQVLVESIGANDLGAIAARVQVISIDVASDDSVNAAAEMVAGKFGDSLAPLAAIVNNAGVGLPNGDMAAVCDVNCNGLDRVNRAFMPLLDCGNGRIVNVTSAAGPVFVGQCSEERQDFFMNTGISWEEIQAAMHEAISAGENSSTFADFGFGQLSERSAYGMSKACANAYTVQLARQFPHFAINACTPGYIETDLVRPYAEQSGKSPQEMGMKSPDEVEVVMQMLVGGLEGNGRYYGSDGIRSPMDKYRGPGEPAFEGC